MYYVGHDGHKDNSVFCITTSSGNVKETFEVPATPEGMDHLIEKMKGKKFKVLAEASTYTIDLHDYFVSKGVESYLAHPHNLKLITESCKKTDRNDSKSLADYLRLWDKHELDMYVILEDKGVILDTEIERQFGQREDVQLLKSIKGIGLTTAAQLMSMIVDVDRFPTADKMRSYFGMAPTVKDSGGSMRHGHITRRGDPMMREILSRTVAQVIKNNPKDSLAKYKESHRGAMRPGMLMVACMNKLLDIIYAILKRGTPYVHK